MALGYLVETQMAFRLLIHIACRDRNMIGTQSHMMELHVFYVTMCSLATVTW